MKATMIATDLIRAGSADTVVAGGMESMSNAPYLLDKADLGCVWVIPKCLTPCSLTA